MRELRNVVQRAYVMAVDDTIEDCCLPQPCGSASAARASPFAASPAAIAAPASTGSLMDAGSTETSTSGAPWERRDTASPEDGLSLPIGTSMAQAERALILATLQHCNFQKERTAAVLGISLKTLYNRLKDYGGDGSAAA